MAKFNDEPLTALRSSRVRKRTLATTRYETATIAMKPMAIAKSRRQRTRSRRARTELSSDKSPACASGRYSASDEEVVAEEQHDGSDHGHHEAGWLPFCGNAHEAPEPAADERAEDAE